jgi:hypothetical protein
VTRRAAIARAVAALVLLAGGGAYAASGAHAPSLEISIIQASNNDAGPSIDPQLKDLPQLTHEQPFTRYNVYRLLDRKLFPLERAKPITFVLPNGRTLQATLDGVNLEKTEKRYKLDTQIGDPGKPAFLKSLHVTASENEPFFVGGQSYQGGTLFLELTVRP